MQLQSRSTFALLAPNDLPRFESPVTIAALCISLVGLWPDPFVVPDGRTRRDRAIPTDGLR